MLSLVTTCHFTSLIQSTLSFLKFCFYSTFPDFQTPDGTKGPPKLVSNPPSQFSLATTWRRFRRLLPPEGALNPSDTTMSNFAYVSVQKTFPIPLFLTQFLLSPLMVSSILPFFLGSRTLTDPQGPFFPSNSSRTYCLENIH